MLSQPAGTSPLIIKINLIIVEVQRCSRPDTVACRPTCNKC